MVLVITIKNTIKLAAAKKDQTTSIASNRVKTKSHKEKLYFDSKFERRLLLRFSIRVSQH